MEWVVKKANLDTERLHLNRILADIRTEVDNAGGDGNLDGGAPSTIYGGTDPTDGGAP